MTDDRTRSVLRPLDERALEHLTRVGGTFAVAGDEGVPYDLRTKAVQRDVIVASTAVEGLERGARLSARAHDGRHALVLVFVLEELEATAGGRSDVLLRLVHTVDRGDERRERRVEVDSKGTVTPVAPFDVAAGDRPLPLTVVEASPSGLVFIVNRRLDAGDAVDLTFDDGTGVAVRCRAAIVRVERAVYGRHRYAARITTMSELDQRRLDRLVSRLATRQDERSTQTDGAAAGGGRGGPLRRLFGRG